MDITYQLQGVEFEWDEEKARGNIANHGVTFEEAAEVFFDPFYQGGDVSTEDEAREFIIGYALSQRLLLVVYVDRRERTRIISARQATRPEQNGAATPWLQIWGQGAACPADTHLSCVIQMTSI